MTNLPKGKHLKVLLEGVSFDKLTNVALVRYFLIEAVHSVGMRELGNPIVFDIKNTLENLGITPDEDEPEGVTGIVVLSTSHVALHTWPHREFMVIDVYSCSDYKTDPLLGVICDTWHPKNIQVTDLSYSLAFDEEKGLNDGERGIDEI